MARKIEEKTIIEKIYDYTLEDIMGERFGRYAKSIIQDRALPDVRDGLKPVQRRILYTMWEDHNTFDKPYRKCAKAVGDVMGKYHPHGDSSIYGAMVYMSQDWKMRDTLIDIHGNNGSIDGYGPAAYRYTECRLAKLSEVMLRDINKNTVEMTLNYSDEDLEPTVLPANFPNLLVNGSTGISAGYATNIPPHNLAEVIDATVHRIDNPNCSLNTILNYIKGPDFPTGGIIEGKAGLIQAYETGKGKIVVKAKTEIVSDKGKQQIIIHEIPYEVLKEALRKKIEDIKIDKKVEGISEVYDVSDSEHMAKIIIELKKDANASVILNYLLKNTDLQVNYNFNVVAIENKRPKQLGLLAILDAFINHQKEVVTRRTAFDLEHAKKRYHILEGLVRAISILDEVIQTIRSSKNKSDSINNLVAKFSFTEDQAKAIVELQLYRLSNTDIVEVENEMKDLENKINIWSQILSNEDALKHVMKTELKLVKKDFASPRRTQINDEITEIKLDMKDMIAKEKCYIVITNEGYIKRVSSKSFASSTIEDIALKPGDYIKNIFETNTLSNVLLFTNLGNYLYIPVHIIGETKLKELGKHVNNIVMMKSEEKVIDSLILDENNEKEVFLVTKMGMVKKVLLKDFEVLRYSKPIMAMKLKDNDELISVKNSLDKIFISTYNGYYLMYDNSEISTLGPKASGVKGINLKDDYVVSAFGVNDDYEYVNVCTTLGTMKRVKLSDLEITSRAKKGSMLFKKVKAKDYHLLNAYPTNSKTINVIKCDNDLKEIKNSDISIMDLSSTGSVISKNKITEVCPKYELVTFEEEKMIKEKQISFNEFIDDFKI